MKICDEPEVVSVFTKICGELEVGFFNVFKTRQILFCQIRGLPGPHVARCEAGPDGNFYLLTTYMERKSDAVQAETGFRWKICRVSMNVSWLNCYGV